MSTPETEILDKGIPEVSPELQIPNSDVVENVPIEVINGALEDLIRKEKEDEGPDVKPSHTIH